MNEVERFIDPQCIETMERMLKILAAAEECQRRLLTRPKQKRLDEPQQQDERGARSAKHGMEDSKPNIPEVYIDDDELHKQADASAVVSYDVNKYVTSDVMLGAVEPDEQSECISMAERGDTSMDDIIRAIAEEHRARMVTGEETSTQHPHVTSDTTGDDDLSADLRDDWISELERNLPESFDGFSDSTADVTTPRCDAASGQNDKENQPPHLAPCVTPTDAGACANPVTASATQQSYFIVEDDAEIFSDLDSSDIVAGAPLRTSTTIDMQKDAQPVIDLTSEETPGKPDKPRDDVSGDESVVIVESETGGATASEENLDESVCITRVEKATNDVIEIEDSFSTANRQDEEVVVTQQHSLVSLKSALCHYPDSSFDVINTLNQSQNVETSKDGILDSSTSKRDETIETSTDVTRADDSADLRSEDEEHSKRNKGQNIAMATSSEDIVRNNQVTSEVGSVLEKENICEELIKNEASSCATVEAQKRQPTEKGELIGDGSSLKKCDSQTDIITTELTGEILKTAMDEASTAKSPIPKNYSADAFPTKADDASDVCAVSSLDDVTVDMKASLSGDDVMLATKPASDARPEAVLPTGSGELADLREPEEKGAPAGETDPLDDVSGMNESDQPHDFDPQELTTPADVASDVSKEEIPEPSNAVEKQDETPKLEGENTENDTGVSEQTADVSKAESADEIVAEGTEQAPVVEPETESVTESAADTSKLEEEVKAPQVEAITPATAHAAPNDEAEEKVEIEESSNDQVQDEAPLATDAAEAVSAVADQTTDEVKQTTTDVMEPSNADAEPASDDKQSEVDVISEQATPTALESAAETSVSEATEPATESTKTEETTTEVDDVTKSAEEDYTEDYEATEDVIVEDEESDVGEELGEEEAACDAEQPKTPPPSVVASEVLAAAIPTINIEVGEAEVAVEVKEEVEEGKESDSDSEEWPAPPSEEASGNLEQAVDQYIAAAVEKEQDDVIEQLLEVKDIAELRRTKLGVEREQGSQDSMMVEVSSLASLQQTQTTESDASPQKAEEDAEVEKTDASKEDELDEDTLEELDKFEKKVPSPGTTNTSGLTDTKTESGEETDDFDYYYDHDGSEEKHDGSDEKHDEFLVEYNNKMYKPDDLQRMLDHETKEDPGIPITDTKPFEVYQPVSGPNVVAMPVADDFKMEPFKVEVLDQPSRVKRVDDEQSFDDSRQNYDFYKQQYGEAFAQKNYECSHSSGSNSFSPYTETTSLADNLVSTPDDAVAVCATDVIERSRTDEATPYAETTSLTQELQRDASEHISRVDNVAERPSEPVAAYKDTTSIAREISAADDSVSHMNDVTARDDHTSAIIESREIELEEDEVKKEEEKKEEGKEKEGEDWRVFEVASSGYRVLMTAQVDANSAAEKSREKDIALYLQMLREQEQVEVEERERLEREERGEVDVEGDSLAQKASKEKEVSDASAFDTAIAATDTDSCHSMSEVRERDRLPEDFRRDGSGRGATNDAANEVAASRFDFLSFFPLLGVVALAGAVWYARYN